jgi:hypothetical protein
MKYLLLIIALLNVSSCTSREEREKEERIQEILSIEWVDGIVPLDEVNEGRKICLPNFDLRGCDSIWHLVYDIAVSYRSCMNDPRTMVCNKVIEDVINHEIFLVLPPADAETLPADPIYWQLPTVMLESYADKYEYRSEVIARFFNEIKYEIAFVTLVVLGLVSHYIYLSYFMKVTKHNQDDFMKEEESILLESKQSEAKVNAAEALKDKLAAQAKSAELIKREHDEKLALKAIEAEKEKLAQEKLANEKLAQEKAEANELLAAIFIKKK